MYSHLAQLLLGFRSIQNTYCCILYLLCNFNIFSADCCVNGCYMAMEAYRPDGTDRAMLGGLIPVSASAYAAVLSQLECHKGSSIVVDSSTNAEEFSKKAASLLFHPENVMHQNVGGVFGKKKACPIKLRSIAMELRKLFKNTMRSVPLNSKAHGLPISVCTALNGHFRHMRSNRGGVFVFCDCCGYIYLDSIWLATIPV